MAKREKQALVTKESFGKHLKRYYQLYLMLVLPVLYFLLFKYAPMFGNVLAFRRYRPGLGPFGTEWVGFRYFEKFMKDASFWRAFRNTLYTSLINLAVNFPIPIVFAIMLNEVRQKHFKKLVQTVSYMPRFISTIIVVAMMNEILSPSSGILNMLRRNMGQEAIYFMNEPQYFRLLYTLSETWQFTGWTAIIYLAAITGIPVDLYEAATIDGAGRLQQIWYVTLPSIMPTIMVMLILSVGRLLSVGYDKVLLMYTPSNSSVSDILDTMVYRIGLSSNPNYSYATAMGLFSGVIGVILVSTSNFISRKATGESIY